MRYEEGFLGNLPQFFRIDFSQLLLVTDRSLCYTRFYVQLFYNMELGMIYSNEKWINMAKFVAIVAVLLHHMSGFLYNSPSVAIFSYVDVSLFIFLMGITTYWSFERNLGKLKTKVIQKVSSIVISYLVATAVYQLVVFHFFDLERYIQAVIHFNASGPLYFILLYIQLIVVSPFLFYIIKFYTFKIADTKKKLFVIVLCSLGVFLISFLTSRYSNILDVYGGGGKLFGGKYLILLYAGMILAASYDKMKPSFLGFFVFLVLTFCWWRFECWDRFALDRRFHFGKGLGQTNFSLMLMSFLVAGLLFNLEALLRKRAILRRIRDIWSWFGSHTLYIFMYHMLFFNYVLLRMEFLSGNIWIKRIGYMSVMLFGPIAMEYVFSGAKTIYRQTKNYLLKEILDTKAS